MIHSRAFRRFMKYALVGMTTLTIDLIFLWALTEFAGVPYYISTPLGFFLGVSLNYWWSRKFVFRGTKRRVHHGYAYFILLAVAAAALITGAVALLVTYAHLPYLVARLLVAGFVGMGNYLTNLHFNFRVAGYHL